MSENHRRPLVILGFDAGDPGLLQRWQQEGRLPTLASIMANGCWAETGGRELLLEHGLWQVIFSGISRAQSGYYYFRQLIPGSYELQLVNGAAVEAPPFWSSLVDRNSAIVVADIPDVLPVPGLKGAQIANWAIHRGWHSRHPAEQPMSEPANLLRQIDKLVGRRQLVFESARATPAEDEEIYRQLTEQVRRKGALCRSLIQQEKPGLVAITFGESHTAGHQFWKYSKPNGRPITEAPELADGTRSIYEAIDREMGLILGELPADANIVVLSSLGLTNHYPTQQLMDGFCRALGYQVPANGARSLRPKALLRQFVPEKWRIGLSRHLSRETRERLLAEQFRTGTNWNKTTAFTIPSIYTGLIRVNLRGREPNGIVEPGEPYESLLQRLERDLAQLIDPLTGERPIEKVIRTGQLFGETPPSVLPDLIVHWRPCSRFLERISHPRCELVQVPSEFNRDSDHYERGFIAAAGPDIAKRGRLPEIDVINLAPTFLELLGLPRGPRMTGRVLKELF